MSTVKKVDNVIKRIGTDGGQVIGEVGGATAGAIIGSVLCPGAGTDVGAELGQRVGGSVGSAVGGGASQLVIGTRKVGTLRKSWHIELT